MIVLLIIALAGCTDSLEIAVTQDRCEDVDLDDPDDPELVAEQVDQGTWVYRTYGFAAPMALFVPDIVVSGRTIELREYWEDDDPQANEVCWFPGMMIMEREASRYTVEWYDGDDAAPWLTLELD